jgi:hypothetical protein
MLEKKGQEGGWLAGGIVEYFQKSLMWKANWCDGAETKNETGEANKERGERKLGRNGRAGFEK